MRGAVRCRGWLLLCRPGFEAACAAEAVAAWGGPQGAPPQVERGPGWVRLEFAPAPLDAAVSFRELVFARQGCWLVDGIDEHWWGGAAGVVTQVVGWRAGLPGVGEVLVEAPDSELGRRLWPACSRVQGQLPQDPRGNDGNLRLHTLALPPDRLLVGVAPRGRSAPWPGGIPRLHQSREAPSRSALKLEEALGFFLEGDGPSALRPGMQAVDLGAAPGGWSWVLARRGVRVVAVDNGALGCGALDTGLVDPVRADGFTYRPLRRVDWLVCDMVAAPARVAKLVGLWGRQGLCRRAVFNLKLPSGDPLVELRRCAGIIQREVAAGGGSCELRFKQLYHDREELTGYLKMSQPPKGTSRADAQTPREPRGKGQGKGQGKGRGKGRAAAGGGRRPGRPGRRRS